MIRCLALHIGRKNSAGGGGQSSRLRLLTDLRPFHSGIFFPQPRISEGRLLISCSACSRPAEKAESFQWSLAANDSRIAPTAALFPDLFSSARGGAVESLEGFDPTPVGPQHKLFRQFRRTFFLIRCVAYPACERDAFLLRVASVFLPSPEK